MFKNIVVVCLVISGMVFLSGCGGGGGGSSGSSASSGGGGTATIFIKNERSRTSITKLWLDNIDQNFAYGTDPWEKKISSGHHIAKIEYRDNDYGSINYHYTEVPFDVNGGQIYTYTLTRDSIFQFRYEPETVSIRVIGCSG